MPTSTKPRRKYRPRVVANPIPLAMRRAGKVPRVEIEAVMAPIAASFKALREGIATEHQWMLLAGSVELALSIERQGIIRGLQGHLTAAEHALAGIKHRAMHTSHWRPTSLYWQEIEALDTFVWLHKTQLEQLSEGEWQRAHEWAENNVRSSGGQVVDVRELHELQHHLDLHEARPTAHQPTKDHA